MAEQGGDREPVGEAANHAGFGPGLDQQGPEARFWDEPCQGEDDAHAGQHAGG